MKFLTKTIVLLSFISLFNDVASEMLYPIMPLYLKSIGFSIVIIGVLEGFAEAVAGYSKGYFGKLSDHIGKRVPFIQLGYALSALSKPMLAVFTIPFWVFLSRSLDKIGKGIRTGARDALLSDEATPETKGKVFGFHRSMDTLGAVLGPALALIYLHYYPEDYKTLFLITFAPGVLTVVASLLLKEKVKPAVEKNNISVFSFLHYWKESSPEYKKLVTGLIVFTLFNSSDVFLLLKMKEAGLSDVSVIGVYIFYNLIYALFAFPIGVLADRLGLKTIFLFGLILFSVVYFGFGLSNDPVIYYALFFLYGIYSAATEGIAKAWISNICEKKDTATAIGTYTAFQSLATMLASSAAGVIWFMSTPETIFLISGGVAFIVVIYLSGIKYRALD